jgi:hypothetical protein
MNEYSRPTGLVPGMGTGSGANADSETGGHKKQSYIRQASTTDAKKSTATGKGSNGELPMTALPYSPEIVIKKVHAFVDCVQVCVFRNPITRSVWTLAATYRHVVTHRRRQWTSAHWCTNNWRPSTKMRSRRTLLSHDASHFNYRPHTRRQQFIRRSNKCCRLGPFRVVSDN